MKTVKLHKQLKAILDDWNKVQDYSGRNLTAYVYIRENGNLAVTDGRRLYEFAADSAYLHGLDLQPGAYEYIKAGTERIFNLVETEDYTDCLNRIDQVKPESFYQEVKAEYADWPALTYITAVMGKEINPAYLKLLDGMAEKISFVGGSFTPAVFENNEGFYCLMMPRNKGQAALCADELAEFEVRQKVKAEQEEQEESATA